MNSVIEPHRQWASRPGDQRYQELAELSAYVHGRRQNSRTKTLPLAKIEAHVGEYIPPGATEAKPTPTLLFTADGVPTPLMPTNYGFGQMAQRVGAPAQYLRKLPLDLVIQCLNHGLVHQPEKIVEEGKKDKVNDANLLQEVVDDGDTVMLRAATSGTYGRIWDADVVDMVQKIIDASGGAFDNPKEWGGKKSGLYASDRDVFMFFVDGGSIVDGGGERDQLHRGFYVWNSEVGNASFGLACFLFRMVCGNHQIWGAEQFSELRIRHSANAPDKFVQEAAPALLDYVHQSARPLEELIRKAKQIEPWKNDDELLKWGVDKGFSRAEMKGAISYAQREEASEVSNLWLLQQGLTAYARDIAWIDARVDLERRAGKLMKLAA